MENVLRKFSDAQIYVGKAAVKGDIDYDARPRPNTMRVPFINFNFNSNHPPTIRIGRRTGWSKSRWANEMLLDPNMPHLWSVKRSKTNT